MKNSLECFNSGFEQVKEKKSVNLKVCYSWDYSASGIGSKKNEDWIEPQRPVEHQQAYQYIHNGSDITRWERADIIFEETRHGYILNLIKNIVTYSRGSMSSKENTQRNTHLERQACHNRITIGSERIKLILEKMDSAIATRGKSGIASWRQQKVTSEHYGNKQQMIFWGRNWVI